MIVSLTETTHSNTDQIILSIYRRLNSTINYCKHYLQTSFSFCHALKLTKSFDANPLAVSCNHVGHARTKLIHHNDSGRIICPLLPDRICFAIVFPTLSTVKTGCLNCFPASVSCWIMGVRTQSGWTTLYTISTLPCIKRELKETHLVFTPVALYQYFNSCPNPS